MDEMIIQQLQNLYGLNPNIPHLALQFPRLPPGLTNAPFKIYQNPTRESFVKDAESINKKLEDFRQQYQNHVMSLMHMNSSGIIPPGHPLYNRKNTVDILKMENDKLLKENLELKKKLEKKNQ